MPGGDEVKESEEGQKNRFFFYARFSKAFFAYRITVEPKSIAFINESTG